MTEIVAAHLERVAESLAPKLAAVLFTRENRDDPQAPTWEELCADPEQESCVNAWLHQVTPLLPIMAAPLTACARESEKPLQKALSDLYHAVSGVGFGHDAKAQKQRLAGALKEAGTLLAALERAAGESK